MRFPALALAVLVLAGCGGGDGEPKAAPTSAPAAPTSATAPPTAAVALDTSARLACSQAEDLVAAVQDTQITESAREDEVSAGLGKIKDYLADTQTPEAAATLAAFNSGESSAVKSLLMVCATSPDFPDVPALVDSLP